MQRVAEASDCITIAVADAPAPALSSSMTATRQRRRSSVESLKSTLRRGSCDVAEFIAKRMPTRRMSVRDRRPMALDLETSANSVAQNRRTSRFTIPRLPSDFMSPVIQVGDKRYNRNRLTEALTKPVKQTKHSLRSVLMLVIVSTLVFGLLSIAWHALHCHMWVQMLHLDRAILLVVPPAIGVVFLIVGLAHTCRTVNSMPDKVLVRAMQEVLGVDDEGLETFRQTAATINKAVDSFEQAKVSYEKLCEQIAEVQAEFRLAVPSGNLRTAAQEMARQVTDQTAARVEGCMRLVAEHLGLDAEAGFAAQQAALADADPATGDEEREHAEQRDREAAQCPAVSSADRGGVGAQPGPTGAGCGDVTGGGAAGDECRGSGGSRASSKRCGWEDTRTRREDTVAPCARASSAALDRSPRGRVATSSILRSRQPPSSCGGDAEICAAAAVSVIDSGTVPAQPPSRRGKGGAVQEEQVGGGASCSTNGGGGSACRLHESECAGSEATDSGTVRPAALPEGWHEAQNAEGRVYYYTGDGKRQWRRPLQASVTSAEEPPVSPASPAVPMTQPGVPSAALPAGWRKVQDAQGRPYYYHRETRARQWHAPALPAASAPAAVPLQSCLQ